MHTLNFSRVQWLALSLNTQLSLIRDELAGTVTLVIA